MSNDERGAKYEVGNGPAQPFDDLVHSVAAVSAAHHTQHLVGCMLQRHVDVREDLLVLRQYLDQWVAQRLRIEVVSPHPMDSLHVSQGGQQVCERLTLRQVTTIRDGILADQVELHDARSGELLGFAHEVGNRS